MLLKWWEVLHVLHRNAKNLDTWNIVIAIPLSFEQFGFTIQQ